jgi:hypothetical protein
MKLANKEDYWKAISDNWEDLEKILHIYLPTFKKAWINGDALPISLGEHLTELKETQNQKLVRAFNAAWYAAPDDIGIWSHKGWDLLCNLCSEEYVILEPKEDK